jgi:hypothetical protein
MATIAIPASRGTATFRQRLWTTALSTLTGRRLALTLRNPRAIVLPLATPVLIAVVIAPALAKVAGPVSGLDYMTYLAIGTARRPTAARLDISVIELLIVLQQK